VYDTEFYGTDHAMRGHGCLTTFAILFFWAWAITKGPAGIAIAIFLTLFLFILGAIITGQNMHHRAGRSRRSH
jgi:drug/metabolite transporter (DMT)-like permease